MASLLGWLGKTAKHLYEDVTPQNEDALRRAQASIQAANRNIQAIPNPQGVLAQPQARQQFIQQNQAPQFNLARTAADVGFHTATTPSNYYNAAIGLGQGIARGGLQLDQSLFNKKTFTPTTTAQKVLFGDAPVHSLQEQYSHNRQSDSRLKALLKITGAGAADVAGLLPSGVGLKVGGRATVTGAKAVRKYDQAQNELGAVGRKVSPTPSPKSPAKIVTPVDVPTKAAGKGTFTGVPKTPGKFKRAFESVSGVISQHGTGGKEIARRLGEHRNQSEIGQEAFFEKIPNVAQLGKKDFETFVMALERRSKGERISVKPHINKAINEWNQAIPSIRDRAVKAGIEVGDLGPNYFPRQYKDLFTSEQKMAKVAQQMVDSGKAKDLGDAIGKLQFMKHEYQRPFGNLESTRQFDLPGYEATHDALTNYVARSFDRISKAEQFGAKNETLKHLLGVAQQEGYHATPGSTLDKYLKIALGDVDKTTTAYKSSAAIRKFNALRSLSTAGLSNVTQLPVNTSTIAGIGRTAKAIATAAVSPKSRAEARQAGVLLDHSVNELAQQGLGASGKITRNIASPFFRSIEKFNRMATAIVGKDYGNHLARKGDVAQLRDKFGVTGEIGKKLTRDQEIQVSRKLVELSQFKVDPMDLPAWVDSPTGKLVAQFRTFGYKQTGFIWNQVLREAVKGNFLPLSRFLAIGVPAGAGTLYLKGKIKGTDYTSPGESGISKAAKSFAAVGGFGQPGAEAQNLYKSKQYGNTPGAVVGVVGGPTASFITETSDNIRTAQQGKGYRKLEKQGVRSIPAIGPSIANRLFPNKPYVAADNTGGSGSPEQRKANSKQELSTLKANPPKGYTLQQTSDGRYAYTLDDGTVKTTAKLQTARNAIAKDAFGDSSASYKVIGDQVLRKSAGGNISITPKIQFDYSLGTAKLTQQKKAGDLSGWLKTADSQLKNIAKQLQDPNIDPLDALALNNRAQTLQDNIAKYKGYGGFTKYAKGSSGRGGGRGGSGGSTASFKTASRTKIARPKGVKVRKLAYGKTGVKTRKLSVSKLPSNYLSKKLG